MSTSTDAYRRRDEILVHRIRSGEKELFCELVRPYLRMLHATVYKTVRNTTYVEEVVQQSIMQAFVHFRQLRSPQFFRSWLLRIAINEARIALRREGRVWISSIEGNNPDEPQDSAPFNTIRDHREMPSEVLERKETQEIVRRAIRRIPRKFREVLILRDIEEYSIGETAKELGLSIPAAKTRLFRARRMLKALFRERSIMAVQN